MVFSRRTYPAISPAIRNFRAASPIEPPSRPTPTMVIFRNCTAQKIADARPWKKDGNARGGRPTPMFLRRLEAHIQDLLRFERLHRPVVIEFTRPDLIREIPHHDDVLRIFLAVVVFAFAF